jgi:uncharacterized protein YndB with AHSA1/START domain
VTAPEKTDAIVRELRIKAKPETIFQFFTDPAKMIKWKGTQAMLDPRPGGTYRVSISGQAVARGEYVEITPYTRIVFTWGWEGEGHPVPPGSSTVEVTLRPDGDGTILRLRHSGLSPEMAVEHAQGWDHYLPRLLEAAEGRDPGVDPNTVESNMPRANG